MRRATDREIAEQAEKKAAAIQIITGTQASGSQQPLLASQQSSMESEDSKNKKTLMFAALCSVLIIVSALLAYFFYKKQRDSNDNLTPSPTPIPVNDLMKVLFNMTQVDCPINITNATRCITQSWISETTCGDVLAHSVSNFAKLISFEFFQLLAFYMTVSVNYTTAEVCQYPASLYPCNETPPINTSTGSINCSGVKNTCYNIAALPFLMNPTKETYEHTAIKCGADHPGTVLNTTRTAKNAEDEATIHAVVTVCR